MPQTAPGRVVSKEISPVELEMIDFFVQFARMAHLPKSVGEIYGLLFSSEEALTFDEVVCRLRMSKGSASQGLRFLRAVNAVQTVYVAGDRRDHYLAEIRLRHLAAGLLRERIQPYLANGNDRLDKIQSLLKNGKDNNSKVLKDRLKRLRAWNRQAQNLLPAVMRLIGPPQP